MLLHLSASTGLGRPHERHRRARRQRHHPGRVGRARRRAQPGSAQARSRRPHLAERPARPRRPSRVQGELMKDGRPHLLMRPPSTPRRVHDSCRQTLTYPPDSSRQDHGRPRPPRQMNLGNVTYRWQSHLSCPQRPDEGHRQTERDIKTWNLHVQNAMAASAPMRMNGPSGRRLVRGCPVQGQERAAVDGGHGEGDKGAGQGAACQLIQPSAAPVLAASLASPRPRPPGLMTDRVR